MSHMPIIKFTTYVEIPVTVFGSAHKAEGDGYHEPYIPPGVEIDDVTATDESELPQVIADYIIDHHYDTLREECEDELE